MLRRGLVCSRVARDERAGKGDMGDAAGDVEKGVYWTDERAEAAMIFLYLALGGMAFGLLQFGVGAMLWAEEKVFLVFGFLTALCGLYIAVRLVALILFPDTIIGLI